MHVTNAGTGSALLINYSGSTGNMAVSHSGSANIARLDKAGVGYFNGGTQNIGADIDEPLDVVNDLTESEPGDVLSIAYTKDRAIEKSAGAYSFLAINR